MIIHTELRDTPLKSPYGLIIGSFDGVHLGHRLLLRRLDELLEEKGTKAIITFSNHPSTILKPHQASLSICSKEHKINLLEDAGVDLLFLLEFTPGLASESYEEFLTKAKKVFPFEFLVVGKGDAFGQGKQGDEKRVTELGKKLHFKADYVEKIKIDGEVVSSGKIRETIQAGDFKKAAKFLGRPYSVYGPIKVEGQIGRMDVYGLCLPPEGDYKVWVKRGKMKIPAKAILSKDDLKLTLERNTEALNGLNIEIIFGENE
ncbi:MAG TPA: FAD synthetase family protein [Rhabdochlamydiaceae bacterium]|nr:FAD synthetase family protein [Rhabdochlamydiaceae bacterium]